MSEVLCGNCLDVMKTMADNSVDAIVTDPPYGLSFMGKKWDYDVPSTEIWEEALRVLKPGGYLLAFAGTRTQHRMAVRIEDAGFEIRDMIAWIYGSGFPKSLNIAKSFEKEYNKVNKQVSSPLVVSSEKTDDVDGLSGTKAQPASFDTEKWDNNEYGGGNAKCPICGKWFISGSPCQCPKDKVEYKSELAQKWEGWGTALKPALEPITVARKPLDGTVASNVLKWGVGGINIDGCRVGTETINIHNAPKGTFAGGEQDRGSDTESYRDSQGRFPANLILSWPEDTYGLKEDISVEDFTKLKEWYAKS